MPVGETTAPEGGAFTDPETGVGVRRLTGVRAHSHHLYFTNSGLWDKGRRLVIGSHRGNACNFYSVELAGGAITQLTDFAPDADVSGLSGFVNPVLEELCFVAGGEVRAVHLRTLQQRALFRTPDGYVSGNLSCTADGKTLCHVVREDLSDRIRMDLAHGYVGFADYAAARPHCWIAGIPAHGGDARVLHEDECWIGHVNTSPTRPDLLTFCHEGPWETVDQRIWAMDLRRGDLWPLRRQKPAEAIGHEYWFADGRRVGYHGRNAKGVHVFGFTDAEGADGREWRFPHGSGHFHSMDEDLIVGDGSRERPHLLLWRRAGRRYDGPRKLLTHRGSFHVQCLHVHPRMFAGPDRRRRVVYTADPRGYGNVHLVDVPDFESLPEADA